MYDDGFFLEDKGVSYGWILGVEAQVDAETRHHAGEHYLVCTFALFELEFNDIQLPYNGRVLKVQVKAAYSLQYILAQLFSLKQCFFIEKVFVDPVVEGLCAISLAGLEFIVDALQKEEISTLV